MNGFEVSAFEIKVIEAIRNSKDPAKALEIAINVVLEHLAAYEKEGKQ